MSRPQAPRNPEHLGDGCFVSFDGYQFWLGANDPRNKAVALEPAVLVAFHKYVRDTYAAHGVVSPI